MSQPKFDHIAAPVSPKLLDYKKIKLHLLNGDVKTKLLLLQALRWVIKLLINIEKKLKCILIILNNIFMFLENNTRAAERTG